MILGSGWAGYGFARTLDPNKYERIMISPRSYFVFTPLLAGSAVGTLEFRAILESVRRLRLDDFHQVGKPTAHLPGVVPHPDMPIPVLLTDG